MVFIVANTALIDDPAVFGVAALDEERGVDFEDGWAMELDGEKTGVFEDAWVDFRIDRISGSCHDRNIEQQNHGRLFQADIV